MKNSVIYISVIFLFIYSCTLKNKQTNKDSEPNNKQKINKYNDIINNRQHLNTKDTIIKKYSKNKIMIYEYDFESENLNYYEDYVGRAYSENILNKHYLTNSKYLDSLINAYENYYKHYINKAYSNEEYEKYMYIKTDSTFYLDTLIKKYKKNQSCPK